MTREETIKIAIPLSLLLLNAANGWKMGWFIRCCLGVMGVYWLSVWFTGSMWTL